MPLTNFLTLLRNFTVTFMNGLLLLASTDPSHKNLITLNLNKLSINFKKKK